MEILKITRPHQWYKNLIIFLALFSSGNFLKIDYLITSSFGFLILICISASNYILNDLIDLKNDKLNPEKKEKPLASGKITIKTAIFFMIILLLISLIASYSLNKKFFIIILGIFMISSIYSLFLKKILFADLLSISSIFILRAVSGAIILNVFISSWLIIGTFFLAMFLVTGKRYGEIVYLGDKANKYKIVLKEYNKQNMSVLFSIFMAILIMTFALYSFSSEHKSLIWTAPLFTFLILRFYHLILTNDKIARNAELIIKDKQFMLAFLLFFIIFSLIVIL